MTTRSRPPFITADLFSGAGGMSAGFHAHKSFRLVAAVDAEIGKPSSGRGVLECNSTYYANMGIEPTRADLSELTGAELERIVLKASRDRPLDVLLACPPCTGFSRANPQNHLKDDTRNSLVVRTALFVARLKPKLVFMENARELLQGNFSHHIDILTEKLEDLGYRVSASIHMLDRFGLPQRRERALVIAARSDIQLLDLDDLWSGYGIAREATSVRRTIGALPPIAAGVRHSDDSLHVSPSFGPLGLRRMQSIPKDGGSWADLVGHPDADELLTPAMKRYVAAGDFGSHPDVYGRLSWDRPCVTIKRECAHTGNGRYGHPEQDRMLSVREMSMLQGFPRNYRFAAESMSNLYRHIGDAVPPLISYQLAHLAAWMLTGKKPPLASVLLANTQLKSCDLITREARPAQVLLPFPSATRKLASKSRVDDKAIAAVR